ncbi:MAG: transketolase C-terminal domain-containing protein [Sphaerochaeta sp.]|uniref:alpha-ketoacid dehydrogenase subunit beta n=1 Tax=Sphaerochaeta associata TaxID=1129264 RepID=UPI002B1F6A41|nr:transketolase C-terminal domain-containing protein [Sphaerochaeta associata]MEA5030500.1 transketolase C-terminal domain-containing protein [Sphaerochaeta associata]MEA5031416.1 transketolase C-terminal domain-containing protein [Sphaerochaeta sp.]
MSSVKTYRKAINEALHEEMARDSSVYLIGEDIAVYHKGGGPSRVLGGIEEGFGSKRIIETPICEGAIIGSSVGAAFMGLRPVAEIMHSEFLSVAMQHLLYGGSKAVLLGQTDTCPVVVRTPYGGMDPGIPFQDESNEQWFIGVPGLKVVLPSSPHDAKGLLKAAIRDDYPVLFLEHKGLYASEGEVGNDDYVIPLGKGRIVQTGDDVTIVSAGRMVHDATKAVNELMGRGIHCELIDLRTIHPFDEELVLKSVEKTGRLIVFLESKLAGSIGNDIISTVVEKQFGTLKHGAVRLCAKNIASTSAPSVKDLVLAVSGLVKK